MYKYFDSLPIITIFGWPVRQEGALPGESKLYENVKKGDVTSIIFLLKTLGKSRGYVERQEIIHDAKISSKVIEWKEIKQK